MLNKIMICKYIPNNIPYEPIGEPQPFVNKIFEQAEELLLDRLGVGSKLYGGEPVEYWKGEFEKYSYWPLLKWQTFLNSCRGFMDFGPGEFFDLLELFQQWHVLKRHSNACIIIQHTFRQYYKRRKQQELEDAQRKSKEQWQQLFNRKKEKRLAKKEHAYCIYKYTWNDQKTPSHYGKEHTIYVGQTSCAVATRDYQHRTDNSTYFDKELSGRYKHAKIESLLEKKFDDKDKATIWMNAMELVYLKFYDCYKGHTPHGCNVRRPPHFNTNEDLIREIRDRFGREGLKIIMTLEH